MKVGVITPTIGSEYLLKCIDSVQNQTYHDVIHYLFIDGEKHWKKVLDIKDLCGDKNPIRTIQLEENVGKGWYGHRVYAACPFLVNVDAICYLDEDNWFDPEHIKSLVNAIKGNQWSYSLRKIVDKDGKYQCHDKCESLGKWPVWINEDTFHIDTSSFLIPANIARMVSPAWYHQWGADRIFFCNLKEHFPVFNCSKEYTLNYRLEGNSGSVPLEFFTKGNQININKYTVLPWEN